MKRSHLFAVVLLAAVALILWGGELKGLPWGWVGSGGGATSFIVLHDADFSDVAFNAIALDLQDSADPASQEIAAAGWRVQVLDDETRDGNDQPHPLLTKLGVYQSITDSRRELLAIRPPDTLVSQEQIPADATTETVLAMIRAKGAK